MNKFMGALSALLLVAVPLSNARAQDDYTGTRVSDDDLAVVTSENNVDRPGSDFWLIRFGNTDSSGACALYCRTTPRCGAYTFVRASRNRGQGICYLKNAVPAPLGRECCVSGIKQDWRAPTDAELRANPNLARTPRFGEPIGSPPPVPARPLTPLTPIPSTPPATPPAAPSRSISREDGVDRPGGDYQFWATVPDVDACARTCQNDTRTPCLAYTFVRPGIQGPTAVCYLKRTVPAPRTNACCISGVIGASTSMTPPATGAYNVTDNVRFDGGSESLIVSVPRDSGRWPAASTAEDACKLMCDNPRPYEPGFAGTCQAFMLLKGGYQVCNMYRAVPPRTVGDEHYLVGTRR